MEATEFTVIMFSPSDKANMERVSGGLCEGYSGDPIEGTAQALRIELHESVLIIEILVGGTSGLYKLK